MDKKTINQGILNESLLEKNIEKLDLYVNEEKISLDKIYNKLIDCSDNYNTSNTNLLLNDLKTVKGNIDKILEKRNKYLQFLNKVIVQYQNLSDEINNKFNSGVDLE